MICVVIVALGHEKIIRVAKNLRVCADCQMAKFMSKLTGR